MKKKLITFVISCFFLIFHHIFITQIDKYVCKQSVFIIMLLKYTDFILTVEKIIYLKKYIICIV